MGLATGMEITTHQRVIELGPRLVRADGSPVVADCDGVFVVLEGDRGRGPIFAECTVCGKPHGFSRRAVEKTPPLAAVGAWTDPEDDGYAKF